MSTNETLATPRDMEAAFDNSHRNEVGTILWHLARNCTEQRENFRFMSNKPAAVELLSVSGAFHPNFTIFTIREASK